MSLEDLLSQDTVTIQSPATGQDANGGEINLPPTTAFANVPARVENASSHQRSFYYSQGIVIQWVVYTQQAGIVNGMLILTSDGLTLRVVGFDTDRAMGTIDTYYEIPCEEVMP